MGKKAPKIILVIVCFTVAGGLIYYNMSSGSKSVVGADGLIGQSEEDEGVVEELKEGEAAPLQGLRKPNF